MDNIQMISVMDNILDVCEECRMSIPGDATVFRQFDHTFCSASCRDRSTKSLDHLYSKSAWPSTWQSGSEKKNRLLRRSTSISTSSSDSLCSLGSLSRVATVNAFTPELVAPTMAMANSEHSADALK